MHFSNRRYAKSHKIKAESNSKPFYRKLIERKWWIFSAFIVGLVIGALGVGSLVHWVLATTAKTTSTIEITATAQKNIMTLAPADYIYSNQTFGSFYYKFYGINNWISAKLTCEKDRAVLPVPRSDEENEFFATLGQKNGQDRSIWLGINDILNERIFVDNDGERISFSNWMDGEPNNGVSRNQHAAWIPRSMNGDNLEWDDARIGSHVIYTLCIFYP